MSRRKPVDLRPQGEVRIPGMNLQLPLEDVQAALDQVCIEHTEEYHVAEWFLFNTGAASVPHAQRAVIRDALQRIFMEIRERKERESNE